MTRLPHVKDSFNPAHTKQKKLKIFEAQKESNKEGFFVIFPLCTFLKTYTPSTSPGQ